MNAVFHKLDNVKIDPLALISQEDKTYCLALFEKYDKHIIFLESLLQVTVQGWDKHQTDCPSNPSDFFYDIDKMDKVLEKYQEIISGLHGTLIYRIEEHFRKTYNLQFTGYFELFEKSQSVRLKSVAEIVDHLLSEVGTDLIESGKTQVIQRFQQLFKFPRHQPELKNNRIIFPSFYYAGYGNNPSLSLDDKNIAALLSAITLIIYDSPVLSENFNEFLNEWKNEIEYNKAYYLQGDISIRFFKNRRVDLSLPSAHIAEKFWQLYQLETIILTINQA